MQLQLIGVFHCLILILIIKSDVSFRNNSVGYVCVLLLRVIYSVESASNCITSDDGITVNCSNKNLTKIPDDLDTITMIILNLSMNPFIELRENSFKKYPNLRKLYLRYIRLNEISAIDLYLFRPLKKLRTLDLSQSEFTERAYFYFPESLTKLRLNQLGVKDADLSNLKNLRELYAQNNLLLELPIIHELAPLTVIDLDSNILSTLTPERLAPFCQLKTLNVNLSSDASLIQSPERYCICARVNLWVQSFSIAGNKLPCNADFRFQCDETFSDDTLSIYNECMERRQEHSGISFLLVLIIGAVFVACSGLGYLGYWFYTNKMKSSAASGSSYSDQTERTNDSNSNYKRESIGTELDEMEYY